MDMGVCGRSLADLGHQNAQSERSSTRLLSKIAGKKGFAGAGKYFGDHLSTGDCHDQKGKSPGVWFAKGAENGGCPA